MIKLDGGLSTALEDLGADLKSILWTGKLIGSAPELLRKAHINFIEAGAQIISSASYQISYIGKNISGLDDDEVTQLLSKSTEIAKSAVVSNNKYKKVKVAASIGPYGAALGDGSEYRGNYQVTNEYLREFHARRIEVLAQTKPDLFAVETIPSASEAKIIQELLDQSEIPYWISFSCKDSKNICEGDSFAKAVSSLISSNNLIAVGINCTNPNYVEDLLQSVSEIKEKQKIDLVVYPNLGKNWDAHTKTWLGLSIDFDIKIPLWKDLGATYIGGCCGVGPKELAQLKVN